MIDVSTNNSPFAGGKDNKTGFFDIKERLR